MSILLYVINMFRTFCPDAQLIIWYEILCSIKIRSQMHKKTPRFPGFLQFPCLGLYLNANCFQTFIGSLPRACRGSLSSTDGSHRFHTGQLHPPTKASRTLERFTVMTSIPSLQGLPSFCLFLVDT